jgi:hypothetical protein
MAPLSHHNDAVIGSTQFAVGSGLPALHSEQNFAGVKARIYRKPGS